MEAVKVFNSELAGLYECKPPISKAKMTAITKAAIRAIKFYKHVVQSVEKFIQKCKTEYKIPGLYVIDSIVRQSRHQFSIEKDVFAPRFAKNITITFYYLFKCPQEDKSKVIRVLNLWQKNQVFGEEVIQPLFDLADPNHSIHKEVANIISQKANKAKVSSHPPAHAQTHHHSTQQQTPQYQHTPQQHSQTPQHHQQQQTQQSQQQSLASQQQQQQPTPQQQSQQQQLFSSQLATTMAPSSNGGVATTGVATVSMPQESNSITTASVVSSLDPNLIQQIQQILMKTEEGNTVASAVAALGLPPPHTLPPVSQSHSLSSVVSHPPMQTSSSIPLPISSVQDDKGGLIPRLPPADYDGRTLPFLPVDTSQPPPGYLPQGFPGLNPVVSQAHAPPPSVVPHHVTVTDSAVDFNQVITISSKSPREEGEHSDESDDNKENQDDDIEIEEIDRRIRSSRSRSASRSKRNKRRSRSPSDSRSRHRRSRSRSRGRRSRSREKDKDRDRDKRERERDRGRRERDKVNYEKEREKERERKKRGLPPLKKEFLSVCSTTLWVGHLSKLVHQEELSDTFGEYGDIVSIDLIPPRGCAFICMNRRQDAARALIKLKNHKMHNKAITLAWAPGKGVKGKEFKDYWEVDVGCSYIPFSKLSQMSNLDLDSFEDGGMIDEETVPQWLKGRYGANSSSGSTIPQNSSHSGHIPPQIANMNVPPPLSTRQEGSRPSMSAVPPPIEKDQRGDNRHNLPPPLLPPFAMQGLPPPGGMTLATHMMPPNLPPNLPPPLGVPPPLGIPPMNVPPGSTMLGQPLLGVPPHVSPVQNIHPPPMAASSPSGNNSNLNNSNTQDSDNMDVEMEDVEKQETLPLNPPPSNRENMGLAERIMAISGRGHCIEFDHRGRKMVEREELERFADGQRNHTNSPTILNKDGFHLQGPEFRNEGFGTFGPRGMPMPRNAPPFPHPSGHLGILSRNGPNFGPRGLPPFSPQRGILPAPPPSLLGSRPGLLPDLAAGQRGLVASAQALGGPRGLGIRPGSAVGGILGGLGGPIQGPRGLSGPPGIVNRFGAPPGGFPRFGIISGPRPLNPSHPSTLEEELHGEWMDKPPAGFLGVRPIERNKDVWNPEMDEMYPHRRTEERPAIPLPLPQRAPEEHLRRDASQRAPEEHLRRDASQRAPEEHLRRDAPPKESSQPPENDRNNKDAFLNGIIRHKEEENEKERFRDRDWDRNRERNREWDRGRDREKEWDRGRDNREKEWSRDREKEWDRDRGREKEWDRNREKDWDRDRIRERDHNRDRDRERDKEREQRWRSRDRERDRDREREFDRYHNNVERYGGREERISDRPYERPSRWSNDDREERTNDKRQRDEEGETTEEKTFEEDSMTWDNWSNFSTVNVPHPQKKAKSDSFPSTSSVSPSSSAPPDTGEKSSSEQNDKPEMMETEVDSKAVSPANEVSPKDGVSPVALESSENIDNTATSPVKELSSQNTNFSNATDVEGGKEIESSKITDVNDENDAVDNTASMECSNNPEVNVQNIDDVSTGSEQNSTKRESLSLENISEQDDANSNIISNEDATNNAAISEDKVEIKSDQEDSFVNFSSPVAEPDFNEENIDNEISDNFNEELKQDSEGYKHDVRKEIMSEQETIRKKLSQHFYEDDSDKFDSLNEDFTEEDTEQKSIKNGFSEQDLDGDYLSQENETNVCKDISSHQDVEHDVNTPSISNFPTNAESSPIQINDQMNAICSKSEIVDRDLEPSKYDDNVPNPLCLEDQKSRENIIDEPCENVSHENTAPPVESVVESEYFDRNYPTNEMENSFKSFEKDHVSVSDSLHNLLNEKERSPSEPMMSDNSVLDNEINKENCETSNVSPSKSPSTKDVFSTAEEAIFEASGNTSSQCEEELSSDIKSIAETE